MKQLLVLALMATALYAQALEPSPVVGGSGGGGSGTVTSVVIAGTADKITVSGTCTITTTGTCTITIPDNVTLVNPTTTGVFNAGGATRTAPAKVGTAAPGTCTVGDFFFDSDATAGSNLLGCTATNTWTVLAGGGTGNAATQVITAYSATPTFTANSNTATSFFITLTGNVSSSTLASASTGQIITFNIIQDGTGGHTFVPPTNVVNMGTIGTGINQTCHQTFVFDGTDAQALGAMVCSGTPAIVIPGSSSGSTQVQATAAASGVMTIPALTSTFTATIASGDIALATSSISSEMCTSAQTDTATGTASTDVIIANFNATPVAITGYEPLTDGGLYIVAYPTTNTVNFVVCNPTANSITPGAATLNWRVVR